MPTGDGIEDACGESSSASARHGSSGRIFVRDEIRNDRKLTVALSPLKPTHAIEQSNILAGQQRKQPWRVHQNLAHANQGKCCWMKCPGMTNSKAKQKCNYDTYMRCKECSAKTGCNIFLCNHIKNGVPVSCHVAYHKRHHNAAP